MKSTYGTLAALPLLCTLCLPVQAHDNAYFDSHPTPHGGQMRMAGPFHLELLVTEGNLTVYVTDHAGTPAPTRELQAHAVVLGPDGKSSVQLSPEAESKLTAPFPDTEISVDTLVLLVVQTPDGTLQQARFTPGVHALKNTTAALKNR